MLALACAFEGALGDAERYRAEAAALIDAMPDDKLAIRLDAIAYLTGAEVYMDRFAESAAHGRRGLAIARATGQGFLLPMLTQASASAISIQGGLLEAAELLDGGDRGLAPRRQRSDARVGSHEPGVRRRPPRRDGRGDRGCRREPGADARPRPRLRLDARRRDAGHRAHGERRAGDRPSSSSSPRAAARRCRCSRAAGGRSTSSS